MDDVEYSKLPRKFVQNSYTWSHRSLPKTRCVLQDDGNFWTEDHGRIIIPYSQLFFYATACHTALPGLGLSIFSRDNQSNARPCSHHQDKYFTTALVSQLFVVPNLEDAVLRMLWRCLECNEGQRVAEKPSPPHDPRECVCLQCRLEDPELQREPMDVGFQIALVDQKGVLEPKNLTEHFLACLEDFSWNDIKVFYDLVKASVRTVCVEIILQQAYLARSRTTRNEMSTYHMWNYSEGHHEKFIFDFLGRMRAGDQLRTSDALDDFLAYIGIEENYRVFSVLNEILKMHHFVSWRSLMCHLTMKPITDLYSPDNDLDQRRVMFVTVLGPYESDDDEDDALFLFTYVVLCVNLGTLQIGCFTVHDFLECVRRLSSYISGKAGCFDRIILDVQDEDALRQSWFYDCCRVNQIAVVSATSFKLMEWVIFLDRIIISYESAKAKNYISDFNIFENIQNIVTLYNRTFVKGLKPLVMEHLPCTSL